MAITNLTKIGTKASIVKVNGDPLNANEVMKMADKIDETVDRLNDIVTSSVKDTSANPSTTNVPSEKAVRDALTATETKIPTVDTTFSTTSTNPMVKKLV